MERNYTQELVDVIADLTPGQIAEALRVGHESIIREAGEWRPLGDHVAALIAAGFEAGRQEVLGVVDKVAEVSIYSGAGKALQEEVRNRLARKDKEREAPKKI